MDRNIVEIELLKIFGDTGLFIDDQDILLQDYFPDSLMFISIIIGIEEAFNIELPDDMLLIQNLGTFNTLLDRIVSILLTTSTSDNL